VLGAVVFPDEQPATPLNPTATTTANRRSCGPSAPARHVLMRNIIIVRLSDNKHRGLDRPEAVTEAIAGWNRGRSPGGAGAIQAWMSYRLVRIERRDCPPSTTTSLRSADPITVTGHWIVITRMKP
jgi:hypothetical protein